MTWQAAHSWKEESAKSGVMLFNAAAAYGLNKALRYRDREPAQIQSDPPTVQQDMQFRSAENEKVSAEQDCCNFGMWSNPPFCIKFPRQGSYLII